METCFGSNKNVSCATNPGGGFLLGSQAQEESIARSSGLYLTLQGKPEYYEYHRALDSSLYSNHIIYSPNVPIFRDDDGNLLEQPWSSAFITAAAVNAGAVRKNEPNHISDILPTLQERARMVLAIAAVRGSEALVLGAWGCGVFQNDPLEVANIFANLLKESMFENRFARVEFAVFDTSTSKAAYNAFLETFS